MAGKRKARKISSKKKKSADTVDERLQELVNKRNIETNLRVEMLTVDQMKQLVGKLMIRQPSFVFDVLEEICGDESLPPSQGPPVSENPDWCKCGNCRQMPQVVENLCCKKSPEMCISKIPEFTLLILEETVLRLANNYRQDVFALGIEEQEEIEDRNRSFRHSAYRQYVLWRHGDLGAGNRKVIPSCCVLAIRGKYPSPTGQYTGFKADRLA